MDEVVTWLIALWLAMHPTDTEVESFQRASHLTVDGAREQLAAARVAGLIYHVDPYKLLAIASHESNFIITTITREPGRRVSCGVMTPTPQRRCSSEELTVIGGYLAGARHYRYWMDHCSDRSWCADIAYGGGMGLVRVCRRGTWIVRPGVDACDLHGNFEGRARRIRLTVGGAS